MAIIGDTVRVKAVFQDWTGAAVDPVDPVLTVYELDKKEPLETIPLTAEHKVDVGTYKYDYVIPDGFGYIVFEMSGTVGGMPQVTRIREDRRWVQPKEG